MLLNISLFFYVKCLQDLDKGLAEDNPYMQLRHLNDDIKQHQHQFAMVLKMDCECNVGLVIG